MLIKFLTGTQHLPSIQCRKAVHFVQHRKYTNIEQLKEDYSILLKQMAKDQKRVLNSLCDLLRLK